MLTDPTSLSLSYIRLKIRETEADFDYFGRCYAHLDEKSSLTDKETRELQRVMRRIKRLNDELAGLWTQQNIAIAVEKVRSADSSQDVHIVSDNVITI